MSNLLEREVTGTIDPVTQESLEMIGEIYASVETDTEALEVLHLTFNGIINANFTKHTHGRNLAPEVQKKLGIIHQERRALEEKLGVTPEVTQEIGSQVLQHELVAA